MKIVDERKKKDVEQEWHVGDVIEYGDHENSLSLGMIIQDDDDDYWLLSLEDGYTVGTDAGYPHSFLNELIEGIQCSYTIVRKVKVELYIKKGNE